MNWAYHYQLISNNFLLNTVFSDLSEGVLISAVKMVKFLFNLTLNEMRFVHCQQPLLSSSFMD